MRYSTVFLDRDGVLNRKAADGDYIKSPDEVELLEGAIEGLRVLNDHGALVLIVTNQRGIALGLMAPQDLEAVHGELLGQLAAGNTRIDGIYHCPHEKGTCDCRKPLPGLFHQAKRDYPGIEFSRSAVIGDSETDMAAAERIGARGVLLAGEQRGGFECAPTLLDAAMLLVRDRD